MPLVEVLVVVLVDVDEAGMLDMRAVSMGVPTSAVALGIGAGDVVLLVSVDWR